MKKETKLYTGISLVKKKFKKNQIYYYLKTPAISIVVPVINEKFLVISQSRIPINKITFEFPGGLVDKGETATKSAAREMLEETGYKSLNKISKLITVCPDPGRLNCKYICFYTKKIRKIKKPEKGIKLHFLTKRKIIKLIKEQKFSHACHIAAFYMYLTKI